MVTALLPTALLSWYLSDPARNQPIVIRLEHFVITSNVSIVAALVAFLVARAALGVGHYRALLIALGFACMAAIFAVHGLSTPGVLQQGDREAPAQLVLGVSAELALAVAAVFFTVRYTPLAGSRGGCSRPAERPRAISRRRMATAPRRQATSRAARAGCPL